MMRDLLRFYLSRAYRRRRRRELERDRLRDSTEHMSIANKEEVVQALGAPPEMEWRPLDRK